MNSDALNNVASDSVSQGVAPPVPTSSLRWLPDSPNQFVSLSNDSKDVVCMIEVIQDRIVRMDTVLCDLEKTLITQVHEYITRQAQYCEALLLNELDLITNIRDADTINSRLLAQLDSSHAMSRNLFQRIAGIIDAPASMAPPPTNSPSKA